MFVAPVFSLIGVILIRSFPLIPNIFLSMPLWVACKPLFCRWVNVHVREPHVRQEIWQDSNILVFTRIFSLLPLDISFRAQYPLQTFCLLCSSFFFHFVLEGHYFPSVYVYFGTNSISLHPIYITHFADMVFSRRPFFRHDSANNYSADTSSADKKFRRITAFPTPILPTSPTFRQKLWQKNPLRCFYF